MGPAKGAGKPVNSGPLAARDQLPVFAQPPGLVKQFRERWFEHRLGLIDERGVVPAAAGPVHAAIYHLIAVLLGAGPGEKPRCWVSRMAIKVDPVDGLKVEWSGTVRPEGAGVDRPSRYGRSMTRAEVLGNLWRAAVWLRMPSGDNRARDLALAGSMLDGVWPADARKIVWPSDPGSEQVVHRETEFVQMRMPNTGMWIRSAPTYDGTGYVVVDLDLKGDEDEPRFWTILRLLTMSPGLPRPHLIVTSKGGRGRHLYYIHDQPAGGAIHRLGPVFGAEVGADAMRAMLARILGLEEWPSPDPPGIEVFPKNRAAGGHMPYLPFGPGSFLCDEHGEVVEQDPLAGMVMWHRQWVEHRKRPLQIAKLSVIRGSAVDAVLAQEAGRLIREGIEKRGPGCRSVHGMDEDDMPASGQPTKKYRVSIRDALDIYENGPSPSEVNAEVMTLARYRRLHASKSGDDEPTADDVRWFRSWIARHPRPNDEDAYVEKFRDKFRAARVPLTEWSSTGMALCPGDVRMVALAVVRMLPGEGWRPQRRRLMATWLYFLARARSVHPEYGGESAPIDVHHEDLERRGCKRYGTALKRLKCDKRIILKRAGRAGDPRAGRPTGLVASYVVVLPASDGQVLEVNEALPDALLGKVLSDKEGRTLLGTVTWRRQVDRARSTPGRRSLR